MRRMALRSQAGDFVRASRAAARRAWSRIDGRGAPPPAPEAPQWLRRGLALLPEEARTALRAALGPERGAEATSEALRRLEGRAAELRHRATAIEAERAQLDAEGRALATRTVELRGRQRDAERLLAQAQRALEEANVERLLPLGELGFDPEDSPRPIRGVARLAASIRRFGQLTPVVLRETEQGYAIVSGYRRLAALAEVGALHVRVRVLAEVDEATAAALYVAENCLVEGVSPNAVEALRARVGQRPGFAEVLPLVLEDDEAAVEELYLEDLAELAREQLSEGVAWLEALRPYWAELESEDRAPISRLLSWLASLERRLD